MIGLFFDTETTGFKGSRLVQLGAILQDLETGKIISELNTMVNTGGFPIPENASNIHGITNQIADKYGITMGAVDKLFGWMLTNSDVIVAHNIQFDLDIVSTNLPISKDLLVGKETFCTMKNTMNVLKLPSKFKGGSYKWPKLIESYKYYFGAEFDNAHDAMADVRACRDIYVKLNEVK